MQDRELHRKILGTEDPRGVDDAQLSLEQLNSVEAIAMDMSTAFVKAAKESIPLSEKIWNHDIISEDKAFFDDWFRRVIRTNLTPLKKVARTIKERFSNRPVNGYHADKGANTTHAPLRAI